MKRDNNLIREILLIAENHSNDDELIAIEPGELVAEFPKITQSVIDEHLRLLTEKGLIESHHSRSGLYIKRLTWDGHDFLGNARNATVWKQAQAVAAPYSWDIFYSALKEFALNHSMRLVKAAIA